MLACDVWRLLHTWDCTLNIDRFLCSVSIRDIGLPQEQSFGYHFDIRCLETGLFPFISYHSTNGPSSPVLKAADAGFHSLGILFDIMKFSRLSGGISNHGFPQQRFSRILILLPLLFFSKAQLGLHFPGKESSSPGAYFLPNWQAGLASLTSMDWRHDDCMHSTKVFIRYQIHDRARLDGYHGIP